MRFLGLLFSLFASCCAPGWWFLINFEANTPDDSGLATPATGATEGTRGGPGAGENQKTTTSPDASSGKSSKGTDAASVAAAALAVAVVVAIVVVVLRSRKRSHGRHAVYTAALENNDQAAHTSANAGFDDGVEYKV